MKHGEKIKKPIPFGKYYLLDRVAVGGMAEVFKAKVISEGGFEKYFAIKRILPSIAEDEEFIKMFIDEAKIAVQLTHSNIVPILDLGKVGDAYFIAMEYVHGRDLRTTFEKVKGQGATLPVPACCYIIMKVCEGLDYAHNKKDAAGRELNFVHRDVSPQNILISFEGEVKLIDFGIAKAANKAAKTQSGILKGKFGYMSPEQVRGLPLDRRSDIFSTGVVLYEILTGERLFVGESDFSVLEKVKNVEIIPPSTYNKNIAEDLERIVLKILAKEVQDRYQTAIELHDDLQSFMYTHGSFFSRKDMGNLMREIFPDEYEEEMKELEMERSSAPPKGAIMKKPSTPPPPRRVSTPPPPPRATGSSVVGKVGSVPPPPPSRSRTSMPPPPPPRKAGVTLPPPVQSKPPPAQFTAPVETAPSPSASVSSGDRAIASQPPAPQQVPQKVTPPPSQSEPKYTFSAEPSPSTDGISMEWDDDEMETQIYDKFSTDAVKKEVAESAGVGVAGERSAGVEAEAAPGVASVISPVKEKPRGVSLSIVLSVMAIGIVVASIVLIVLLVGAGKKKASLIIVPEPRNAIVKVDGEKVESEFPPTVKNLKPGKHTLVISAEGYETKVIEMNLSSGQNTQVVNLIRKKAGGTGFSIETEPPGATITIDGKRYSHTTPARIIDLKEGTHTIRIEKDNYLPYTTEVQLRKGEVLRIPKVVLSPKSITASINSVPERAKVYLIKSGERKYVGKTPYTGELDPAGKYAVEVEKSGFKTWSKELEFAPGQDKITILAQLESEDEGGEAQVSELRKKSSSKVTKKTGRKRHRGGSKKAVVATSAGTGYLSVQTQPWTVVYVDGRKVRNTPLVKYPLPAGQHKVRLINTQFNINQAYTVIIVAGQVTKIIRNLAR